MAVSRGRTGASTRIVLELGRRRVFASALDWPGWSRSGKGEAEALGCLAQYGQRYSLVAAEAGVAFAPVATEAFDIVERLPGSATTDFGAPGAVARSDYEPLTASAAARTAHLVRAAWTVLDGVVAASPPTLRKGPRGGGRDRDELVEHLLVAEAAYARRIGIKVARPERRDTGATVPWRDQIEAALRRARSSEPTSTTAWPPRYAARRIAWHTLDHAWEIEDRRDP